LGNSFSHSATSVLKSIVRRSLASAGFRLERILASNNHAMQVALSLKRFAIDVVLDVGANQGQFARDLRDAGYQGRIVSFEPLPDAHAALSAHAQGDSKWTVHPPTAVGDFDGTIAINVAGNSVSSSVLPMLDAHAQAARNSAYVSSLQVPIARLDSLSASYVGQGDRVFLKIDTQGFEKQVLDGAPRTLRQACGVHCEMSIVELYAGQHLWKDMLARLEGNGFGLWSIQEGFTDERDGRSLQFDATLFRNPTSP
jgi:FkbM family methyltransferase